MNICSDKHEEIAHEGAVCPICKEVGVLEEEIEGLKADIEANETTIDEQAEKILNLLGAL